jgi:protein-tyrosine phosphatase
MAAALLAARLRDGGVDATVTSAGRLAGGVPAESGAVHALAGRGIDLAAHRSTSHVTDPTVLADVDLVLGMAREHVRDVVVADPAIFPRAFTLKELVRRGRRVGRRHREETVREWLARVHAGRMTLELVGDSPDDDVNDPIGGPDTAFEATAAELDALLAELVALLA